MVVEDYPAGYPRFSTLIATHNSFLVCRRFSNVRARLLLLKQDRISALERKLEEIDRDELCTLFLGSSRRDSNKDRSDVLSEIDAALADYDLFVERHHRMLGFAAASPRDVASLRNWVNGNTCLAREETTYLDHHNDLFNIAPSEDGAVTRLEVWVEDCLIRFCKSFYWSCCHALSKDRNVYICSSSMLTQIAQALIASVVGVFLLVPMLVCSALDNLTLRMLVITLTMVLFITTLSGLVKARTVEMILAGAAYAAVLIGFMSGTQSGPCH